METPRRNWNFKTKVLFCCVYPGLHQILRHSTLLINSIHKEGFWYRIYLLYTEQTPEKGEEGLFFYVNLFVSILINLWDYRKAEVEFPVPSAEQALVPCLLKRWWHDFHRINREPLISQYDSQRNSLLSQIPFKRISSELPGQSAWQWCLLICAGGISTGAQRETQSKEGIIATNYPPRARHTQKLQPPMNSL